MNGNKFTIGVTDDAPIENDRLRLGTFTPFVSGDISKRTDPKSVFSDVKSIVVVCVPYDEGENFSNLSSLGVCNDYHKRVQNVLKGIANTLIATFGSFNFKILVDSPTLCERSLAVRAGLGFFSKNGLVNSPEFGTRMNIGLMLADFELTDYLPQLLRLTIDDGTPNNGACPVECNICIKACPNGALSEGKPLNAGMCISYLTQKETLTSNEEKLLHGQLYGCDICQNVCPKNTKRNFSYVDPIQLLDKSDACLAKKYSHTAMMWRIKLLRRNASLFQDVNTSAKLTDKPSMMSTGTTSVCS